MFIRGRGGYMKYEICATCRRMFNSLLTVECPICKFGDSKPETASHVNNAPETTKKDRREYYRQRHQRLQATEEYRQRKTQATLAWQFRQKIKKSLDSI